MPGVTRGPHEHHEQHNEPQSNSLSSVARYNGTTHCAICGLSFEKSKQTLTVIDLYENIDLCVDRSTVGVCSEECSIAYYVPWKGHLKEKKDKLRNKNKINGGNGELDQDNHQ